MKTIMLRIRIEPELKQNLETAIQEGQAKTISELVRLAVKEHLSQMKGQA